MTRTDLLTGVIKAVADIDGVEPQEMPRLNRYIDPEILKTLDKQEKKADWSFTFQFTDHEITVTHDSQIIIDGQLYSPNKQIR